MKSRVAAVICGLVLVFAASFGIVRVASLEDRETVQRARVTLAEVSAHESATDQSARLIDVPLVAGQRAVFEVCAEDRMLPAEWQDELAFAVWRPRARELMTRTDLTAEVLARAQRDDTHACLVIGRGPVAATDRYAIEALWSGERPPRLFEVPLVVSVQARQPLGDLDLAVVGLLLLGSFGLIVSLALEFPAGARQPSENAGAPTGAPAPSLSGAEPSFSGAEASLSGAEASLSGAEASFSGAEAQSPVPGGAEVDPWQAALAEARPSGTRLLRRSPELRVLVGLVAVVAAFVASGFVPGGAAATLSLSALLAAFQVTVALTLAGRGVGRGGAARLRAVGVNRPARWWLHFPIAIAAGAALVFLARWATRVVPSTSESAIQAFVSWPSGMLSFACLAVIAPLAEELFFRGFVFGALEVRGRLVAFAASWGLFVLAHVPQLYGQWGALVALVVLGLGLTALRAFSRSLLPAAVAHLVYNGALALGALGAAT